MWLRARNVNKPDTDFDSAPSGRDATISMSTLKAGEKKKKKSEFQI